MKKSTCYRLCRNKDTGASEYVITPSFLEVMIDSEGKAFNIHFHKVIYENGVIKWSATEESTGLKCIIFEQPTRKEAYEAMLKIIPKMNKLLSIHSHYVEKLRDYKEKNNLK